MIMNEHLKYARCLHLFEEKKTFYIPPMPGISGSDVSPLRLLSIASPITFLVASSPESYCSTRGG